MRRSDGIHPGEETQPRSPKVPIPHYVAEKELDFALGGYPASEKHEKHLVSSGICPSTAPRPGLQPPVFCDRDVDPKTGAHTDGAKMHRGHDGTGDALWG